MSTSKDVSSSGVKGGEVNAAKSAVFVSSSSMPNDTPIVTGSIIDLFSDKKIKWEQRFLNPANEMRGVGVSRLPHESWKAGSYMDSRVHKEIKIHPYVGGATNYQCYSWDKGLDYEGLLATYKHCGFQATNFGLAVEEINKMLECRSKPLPPDKETDDEEDEFIRVRSNCTIFLGYTSNIVSSGLRDTIRYLVKNRMVDCIVTTAGGVEEDFIKCLAPTYIGSFDLDGRKLRDEGINRIGNLMVPNSNYCAFEDWIVPLLDEMLEEQKTKDVLWTPSKMIAWLGSKINNEESIYYWASKNTIPVFCPALTDGSLGDMMFFHSFRKPGLILDILSDLRRINRMAMKAVNSGMIIIGGGVIKHHICNANLMRNGADFAVFVNTASEFDGSDSGARPDEAISWGKIKKTAAPVKIYAEASLVLPLLVMETFAKFLNKK